MQTAYSRVTVVTTERTVDLALPAALPMAEILPQLLRYVAPSSPDANPATWVLSRLGGTPLSLTQTLAEAAVTDGDVLELGPEAQTVRAVAVDDVRDAVEDSVDSAGGSWTTRTTASFTVLTGSATLVLLAVLDVVGLFVLVGDPGGLASIPTAAASIVVLVAATWWASLRARRIDAQLAAIAAMVWGVMLGLAVCWREDATAAVTLAACAAGAALVACATRALTAVTTGHVAFAGVLLLAAAVALVAQVDDVAARSVPRLLPVLALLAVGAIPRVSLSVGGLASADYRVRNVGVLDLDSLQARYRTSNAVLIGSLAGIAFLVAWFGTALALAGDTWDRSLAVALAVAVALRSRAFSRTPHMVALRLAGVWLAVLSLGRLALDDTGARPWLGSMIAGALAVGLALTALDLSEIPRARVKRSLNVLELLTMVVVLVLLFGSLAVYAEFKGIFR